MKKTFLALLLTAALLFSLSQAVFAADSVVTIGNEAEGIGFAPGSDYTATDLFDELKGCMPGDSLTETITVKNRSTDSDRVIVSLRAEVADPTYSESYEAEDGNDQAGIEGKRDETAASMADFLAKLPMRVYSGDTLLYDGNAACGGLASAVRLGDLRTGEELQLRVELDVPETLGSEYANRVGEVKWVFHAEALVLKDITVRKEFRLSGDAIRSKDVVMNLYRDGQIFASATLDDSNNWTYVWRDLDVRYTWDVLEEPVGNFSVSYSWNGDEVTVYNTAGLIHTGQLVWPIPVLGGLGMLFLLMGVVINRKAKQHNA